jgi:dethiobiotin synthetase/adenosylmethionine--8-amino-7-oxononanoate aminotransferase
MLRRLTDVLGVHSPTLSGTTQLDAYRPLFLPTILIGDSRLGGISSTISAYESLQLRGYNVDALLLFSEEYYRNYEYLTDYFRSRGVRVASLPGPPPRVDDEKENFQKTEEYYASVVPAGSDGPLHEVVDHLDACHLRRVDVLANMPRRTLDTVWWPFVQHGLNTAEHDVAVIDSAHGDFFSVHTPPAPGVVSDTTASLLSPQLDGSASWWTQTVGHANPRLALAAARAAGRYGHVMFPQATHLPALKLSEKLVHDGPGKGWAARAFISDNGSTGMEVALKMALRTYIARHKLGDMEACKKQDLGILGLQGSYHGDTIGAMNACEAGDGVYTCEWHQAKGYWMDPPTISMRKGTFTISLPSALSSDIPQTDLTGSLQRLYNVSARLNTDLANHYRRWITEKLTALRAASTPVAALVLEPLVLGAGGMRFVDPLFQRVLVDLARDILEIPVVYDEVFTGLHRVGFARGADVLGTMPDIAVYAKVLTGGTAPLAVTLATDEVFRAFWSERKADALLHGHSYSAYAVGCEVANETLAILDELKVSEGWTNAQERWSGPLFSPEEPSKTPRAWSFWDPEFVKVLSQQDRIQEVMTLGTVLAFKTTDSGGLYSNRTASLYDDADHVAGYQSMAAQDLLRGLKKATMGDDMFSAAPGGSPYGIHFRTLGNVAYFMLSLNTPAETIRSIEDRIWSVVSAAH